MKIQWRHDWLLATGAGITLLFAIINGITLGLGSLTPFMTGFLLAFPVTLGIVRSVGQRGLQKRSEELESMQSDLKSFLSRMEEDVPPHRVPLTINGIKKNVQAYLREGEARSQEERDESKLMAHRPNCSTPWMQEGCDCKPVVMPYNDVLKNGPEAVAQLIYARMQDEQSFN